MNHAPLRDQLIADGTLRPAGDPTLSLMPARLPPGAPVLRLDDLGRAAAQAHIRQGRNGALIMRVAWDSR